MVSSLILIVHVGRGSLLIIVMFLYTTGISCLVALVSLPNDLLVTLVTVFPFWGVGGFVKPKRML